MRRDWLPITTTPWSLGLLLVTTLLLIQATELPSRINDWMYDRAITTWPAPMDDSVAIIAIDEFSLEQVGRWPWDRSLHASLIDTLRQAGAETIVLDILFPEAGPGDEELASAMARHGNVALPAYLTAPTRERLISEQLPPTPSLAGAAGGAIGHAHIELDTDGVARGLYLYNGLAGRLWPTLSLAAHLPMSNQMQAQLPNYINVREDYRLVPPWQAGGPAPYPPTPMRAC